MIASFSRNIKSFEYQSRRKIPSFNIFRMIDFYNLLHKVYMRYECSHLSRFVYVDDAVVVEVVVVVAVDVAKLSKLLSPNKFSKL